MTLFIISGIVLSIAFSLFGLMFTSGMKDGWKRAVVAIIISLACGFGFTALMFAEQKYDAEQWNNGHCLVCDGEYNLIDVEHHRNGGDTYYYECEDCKNLIETSSHFH